MIDNIGDAYYGTGSLGTPGNNFGYDYVFDVDWTGKTYDVYELNSSSQFEDVFGYNSPESSPWRLDRTNSNETLIYSKSFSYSTLSDGGIALGANNGSGFVGANHHYVFDFDLGFLDPGTEFIAHFTMKCGNDNLMGSATTSVPEPANMLLLGSGLIVMAGLGRKRFFKK